VPSLRSIVYVSTAVRLLSSKQQEALLLDARAFNQQNALTGVLLYSGSSFMQCLEGPDAAVRQAYRRILISRKHKELIELMDSPISRRAFGEWVMGSAITTHSELLAVSTAQWTQLSAGAPFPTSIPPGLGMLQVFWAMRLNSAS
jgi:hypothetical protein